MNMKSPGDWRVVLVNGKHYPMYVVVSRIPEFYPIRTGKGYRNLAKATKIARFRADEQLYYFNKNGPRVETVVAVGSQTA